MKESRNRKGGDKVVEKGKKRKGEGWEWVVEREVMQRTGVNGAR